MHLILACQRASIHSYWCILLLSHFYSNEGVKQGRLQPVFLLQIQFAAFQMEIPFKKVVQEWTFPVLSWSFIIQFSMYQWAPWTLLTEQDLSAYSFHKRLSWWPVILLIVETLLRRSPDPSIGALDPDYSNLATVKSSGCSLCPWDLNPTPVSWSGETPAWILS